MIKAKSQESGDNFYNFIIVGTGPAGLTAGIIAAKKGFSVIILERGKIPGPLPRGETIHYYPLLDEILGEGFISSISKHNTSDRLFHSPKNVHQSKVKASSISFIFEWKEFINRFEVILKSLNVEIRCNSEVLSPIEENDICIGVNYMNENGENNKIYGNAILACDGYDSVIGKSYNIDYTKVNNPIIKCLVKNANIDINERSALELFLLAHGELDYAPQFPPCALFIFPRGGKELEAGLMLFTGVAYEIDTVEIPDEKVIMTVWEHIKKSYPGFSEFFIDAEIYYEALTGITSSNFIKDYLPKPGVVLIGDSAGFIEATGSSGIYSSMAMAEIWTTIISNELLNSANRFKGNNEDNSVLWDSDKIKLYKKDFQKTEIYKHVINVYKMYLAFLRSIFKGMKTAEEININWQKIIAILQKAKSST